MHVVTGHVGCVVVQSLGRAAGLSISSDNNKDNGPAEAKTLMFSHPGALTSIGTCYILFFPYSHHSPSLQAHDLNAGRCII